jgi:hypothetical protein
LALPFAYVILDLVENAAVLGLLAAYPERVRLLAAGLPYVTILKRAASLLTLVVPLMLLGIRVIPLALNLHGARCSTSSL